MYTTCIHFCIHFCIIFSYLNVNVYKSVLKLPIFRFPMTSRPIKKKSGWLYNWVVVVVVVVVVCTRRLGTRTNMSETEVE